MTGNDSDAALPPAAAWLSNEQMRVVHRIKALLSDKACTWSSLYRGITSNLRPHSRPALSFMIQYRLIEEIDGGYRLAGTTHTLSTKNPAPARDTRSTREMMDRIELVIAELSEEINELRREMTKILVALEVMEPVEDTPERLADLMRDDLPLTTSGAAAPTNRRVRP